MKNLSVFITYCILFAGICSYAQVTAPKPASHEYYLDLLSSSKDSLFTQVIRLYDLYCDQNPHDYIVHVERCKFIERSYYDEYEDYNPKYEECEQCLSRLLETFPDIPEVLLYKSESLYGDSAIVFLEKILSDYEREPALWKGKGIWKIYHKLAETLSYNDKTQDAIMYGELAAANNDTLDISLFLAEQYVKLSDNAAAIKLLLDHLDSSDTGWELNRKGKLLLELGVPDRALEAFRLAKKDSFSWQDAGGLAQAMIENGFYAEAREYLVKDMEGYSLSPDAFIRLFKYDIEYGSPDSALVTYRGLTEMNFWNDALGIYRLQLLFHSPLLPWKFFDFLRVFLLFASLAVVLIVPYTWILPIHYVGAYFKNKGLILPDSEFRWNLRHLWIVSSLFLLVDLISNLVFQYYELLFENENDQVISENLADKAVFLWIGFALVTALFLKRSDGKIFWGTIWSKKKSVLIGVGMAFLLWFGEGMLKKISHLLGFNDTSLVVLSAVNDIKSINQFYHPLIGLFFVVILVPVYEEILFRGIFLSACGKHVRFFWANCIQSLAFALIHQQWKLIPFYFAFGIVTGIYCRKSRSLAPGITIHMTNNLLAFMGILHGRV